MIFLQGYGGSHPENELELVTDAHLSREIHVTDAHIRAFSRRLHDAVRREVPAYAAITSASVESDVLRVNRENVVLFFRCLAEDRQPLAAELDAIAASARSRLRQGIPLEAIFRSYRVGVRVLWECLLEVAPQQDHGRLGVLALEYADRVSTAAAAAYLEERQRVAQSRHEATRLLLTRVIAAEVDEASTLSEAAALGFDFSAPHVVVVATVAFGELSPNTRSDLALAAVQTRLHSRLPACLAVLLSSGLVAAVPVPDAEVAERLVARAATGTPGGEPTLAVGVGTPRAGITGLAASYQEAVRARALGRMLHPGRTFHRYGEVALFDLFKEGETIDAFVREALGPVLELDAARCRRLIETLDALFASALNRKQAAFRLGVHQNTLSNRIRRAEALLGGSIVEGERRFHIELALRLLPLTSLRGKVVDG